MRARFGVEVPSAAADDVGAAAAAVFTEAALFSTRYVVERVERFCTDNGVELLVMLSHGEATIRSALAGEDRFDQPFGELAGPEAGDLSARRGPMSGFAVGQGSRQRTTSHTLRCTPVASGGSFRYAVIM